MRVVERYIVKRIAAAFVVTLLSLAGVVWTTQALRQFDLVTAKGQTIWLFLEITFLALPFLILIIAPFALMIAIVAVLNQFNNDSELVVINAAGAPPAIVLRPLLAVAGAVALCAALLSIALAPAGLRALRAELSQVRADLVANIVKPGRFIEIDDNLTFHIRDRLGDGSLAGLLLDDRRKPDEIFTYLAERGQILRTFDRTLLVMNDGTIQRRTGDGDLSIVEFQSYGFDLTSLAPQNRDPVFKASERFLSELIWPDMNDVYVAKNVGRIRSDLHDRLTQPLYPFAFALIAFLFLGEARTTRQSRGLGIVAVLVACFAVRLIGFAAVNLTIRSPLAAPLVYLVPIAGAGIAGWYIAREVRPSPPRSLVRFGENVADALTRLAGRLGAGVQPAGRG